MPREMNRQAVDSTTEDYWEEYFGPYGKQWVRKIPRRVASALIQRTAGRLSENEAQEAYATASVHPFTDAPSISGSGVTFEGVLRYRRANREVSRLFRADFDHEGRLRGLDSLPAPVAA